MDYEYLNRRMTEERQRAADADSDAARQAHLELAEHYAAQLDRLCSDEQRPALQAATA